MEPHRDQDLNTETPPQTPPPAATPAPVVPTATPTGTAGKADLGKRFLAMLIDGVVAFVASAVIGFISNILGILVAAAYYLVRDGLEVDFMKRRSLGKQLMKLNVVRLDGQPMDIETSVKRNWMWGVGSLSSLLWYIPFLGWALIPIVGFIALGLGLYEVYKVLTDSEGRRWGDEMANTKVIETHE